jgi:hypothetical protein
MLDPHTVSPNYPRYVEPDLLVKKKATGIPGVFSYTAELTDSYHNTDVSGPARDSEAEAIQALSHEIARKAERLRLRSQALRAKTEPSASPGVQGDRGDHTLREERR